MLPLKALNNVMQVELLSGGYKYTLSVTKTGPVSKAGPNQYFLVMNGSQKTVDVLSLINSGLLISINGTSYTTYLQTEVDK